MYLREYEKLIFSLGIIAYKTMLSVGVAYILYS